MSAVHLHDLYEPRSYRDAAPGEMVACRSCSAEWRRQVDTEAAERAEYAALDEYHRGAYDYVGQQGGSHTDCMAATRTI